MIIHPFDQDHFLAEALAELIKLFNGLLLVVPESEGTFFCLNGTGVSV